MNWDWLFPRTCVGCGKSGEYVCASCVNELLSVREMICPMCARGSMDGRTHARCEKAHGMDGLLAVCRYRGVMKKLIGRFKYRLVRDELETLLAIIWSMADLSLMRVTDPLLVPVPLHADRLRWRGFNQAALIAQGVAREMGWEYREDVVRRVKKTHEQQGKHRDERLVAMKGVFGGGEDVCQARDVVIVDDVWTTGATMRAVAQVVKRKGADRVWGLVLAR